MQTVTVSSTYQVMIPNTIREMFELQPGQKIQVIPYKNRIELVPIASLQDARGLLKGIDPNFSVWPLFWPMKYRLNLVLLRNLGYV